MDERGAILADVVLLLEETNALKQVLKERSMIYQYDLKCAAARALCMDAQTLFDLPYTEWEPVRTTYLSSINGEA